MNSRFHFGLFFLLFSLHANLLGQNTIAFPEVTNFTKQNYQAGLQNWDFKQGSDGKIFVANNEGLLVYDGTFWSLYPLPNKTIVRSIEIDKASGRIYVGGQDELGYFEANNLGKLEYQSLINLLPTQERNFGDVWDIVFFQKAMFVRTNQKIFQIDRSKVKTYPASSEWVFMCAANQVLYAHDLKKGLLRLENNQWLPVFNKNFFPSNDPITSIIPSIENQLVVSTLKNGLFNLKGDQLFAFTHPNNRLFAEHRIYAATGLDNGWIALATNNKGVYIINQQGEIIQHFSKSERLQNNNVLSVFLDQQKNLWLGLDNGIDFIAYNSPVKQLIPLQEDGPGYTAIVYNQHLYLGTSNGLFKTQLETLTDISFSRGKFEVVPNTKGQNWSLSLINNKLLLGHHDGIYQIENNKGNLVESGTGYWNFLPYSLNQNNFKIAAGNYKGITFFENEGGRIANKGNIPGFIESSRYIVKDQANAIWVSHPYHGIYRIRKKDSSNYSIDSFSQKDGLPSNLNNHVFMVNQELVIATEKGVYTYAEEKKKFEPSINFQKILGSKSIRYLREDKDGNVWFIHEKEIGVIDYSGEIPKTVYLPEMKNKILSGFEFIYPLDAQNILVGGEKGFFHINYQKYKLNASKLRVDIGQVKITHTKDSLIWGGFPFKPSIDNEDYFLSPKISSDWKSIKFQYSSTTYGQQANVEYSFRLKGYDEDWSEWNNKTFKEYTNLNNGKYTFEVKARNNLGNESDIASFQFSILPPWYKTSWARIFFTLIIIVGVFYLYRWQQRSFQTEMKKLEDEQNRLKYIHELEITKTESELVALRNANLEAEINFKNTEMASTAMHLLKKGELLSKIKTELSQLSKRIDHDFANSEIKKLIKSLSEDENMDQEWESFSKHFDQVHANFVVKLKETHPDLTNNELKLCTYLRMNLTSKEIAQLLNISVRGVEISRYRLRKKLLLPTEMSIFDYLIGIK